ncbi:UDP-N-acetylmuramate dehydrogenase [Peribacillus sp. NPDC096540]|uniref:UDP-N-acetylmuramate dehydrogenase n=1 Tax=Peribacillus sp. NPDC096540 TaxID=3390612 RepID=UPI003D01F085
MNDKLKILKDINNICPDIFIRISEPLYKHTYIQTGGAADIFIQPKNIDDVQRIIQYSDENKIPFEILGYGSNVIIKDKGIRGIVINLNHLNKITIHKNEIMAESGASIIDVSRTALQFHLSGLEFACGIPGSVGGALIMNAGAYDGEISYVLKSAKVITLAGDILNLSDSDFQFGYRTSVFEKEKYKILEATFILEKSDPLLIREKMDTFRFLRKQKQPLEFPSCGSVFKRPPNQFAGKLISESGLQGMRIGGAEVSMKHAGFIVNVDHATSTDYLLLIRHIQETVNKKFDIQIDPEVKILGED